jgi:hypothetical protein
LTDTSKVEEGLGALFQELHGEDMRINSFEDITVGWETQIVAYRLLPHVARALVSRQTHLRLVFYHIAN